MKKQIINKTIIIVLGIMTIDNIKSQANNFVNPNGSINLNTSNMEGIFSTAMINESEGVPEIKISLFNLKSGDIDFPVKLVYDAKGIKTNQRASNVGLGWTLYIPAITRQINDANDFDDNLSGTGGYGPKRVGYFTRIKDNLKYDFSTHSKNDLVNIDEIPDQYTAVLLDGASSFFFENESSYQLMTRKRIKILPKKESHIEMQSPDYINNDFYKISILNDNGFKYDFNDIEICNFAFAEDYFNTSGSLSEHIPTISNWKVSKNKDTKDKELLFEYTPSELYNESNYYNGREISSGYYSKLVDFQNNIYGIGYYYNILTPYPSQSAGLHLKGFLDPGMGRSLPINTVPNYEYKSILESKNYKKLSNLTKITSKEGFVKFNYDYTRIDSQTGEKALSSVELYDINNKLVKKYDFIYSYFDNVDLNSSISGIDKTKRLRLDKIVDQNNLSYEFKYDNTPLPGLNSKAFDYAGYYNGSNQTENYTSMPDETYYYPNQKEWSLLPFRLNPNDIYGNGYFNEHIIQYNNGVGGITREPNESLTKAGVLTDIIYPTKGSQNFEYELNDFKIFEKVQPAPGLRVKKINFKEGNVALKTINYKYIDANGYSSGKMMNPPYIGYPKTQLFKAERIINNQDPLFGTIQTDYNGLPNFNTAKLGMLFKVVDRPSNISIYYDRVEKSETGKGKTVTEYTNNEELKMGNSWYSPVFSASTSTPLSSIFPYWVNVNLANGLFTSAGYEFPEFLATNSGYNLRFGSIIDYSKLGKIKKLKVYNNAGDLLLENKINYKYIHPNFSVSADKYFSKPIFHTIPNTFNGSNYMGFIYNPQGTINVQNYYTAQLIESTEETSYLASGSVYKKIFYEYYLNDHSMPLTHTYEVDPTGYIKGKIFKFQTFNDQNVINNNLTTQIVGEGTFTGNDILDDYNRPYMTNDSYETVFGSDVTTNNLYLPKSDIHTKRPNFNTPEVSYVVKKYNLYDNKGNLLEYSNGEEGVPITRIWGYHQTLPIAEIEGIKYNELMTLFGLSTSSTGYLNLEIVSKSNLDIDTISENNLITSLDNFRKNAGLKNYKVTTYIYDPLVGIKKIISPSGIMESYIYDTAGRVEKIIDTNQKVLKQFKYHYKN